MTFDLTTSDDYRPAVGGLTIIATESIPMKRSKCACRDTHGSLPVLSVVVDLYASFPIVSNFECVDTCNKLSTNHNTKHYTSKMAFDIVYLTFFPLLLARVKVKSSLILGL